MIGKNVSLAFKALSKTSRMFSDPFSLGQGVKKTINDNTNKSHHVC